MATLFHVNSSLAAGQDMGGGHSPIFCGLCVHTTKSIFTYNL
jgi:hypothetical protein